MTDTPSAPAEPLPCPFCGEALDKTADHAGWMHPWNDCVAAGVVVEQSLDKWNRRAPPAAAPAEDVEARAEKLVEQLQAKLSVAFSPAAYGTVYHLIANALRSVAIERLGGAGDGVLREALAEVLDLFDKDGALFCSGEWQLEVIGRARAALPSHAPEGRE